MGAEVKHQTHLTIKTLQADQKAHKEITDKMSRLFDALACAVVLKSEMLDSYTVIIKSLTDTMAELTATNKKLVDQLAATLATCIKPPPGLINPPATLSCSN